eukprot:Rhum_TRINITY_DN3684_c0_g1::Rhum_TRINITY_DN3684_c0_g1_i1::g.11567::m.11567
MDCASTFVYFLKQFVLRLRHARVQGVESLVSAQALLRHSRFNSLHLFKASRKPAQGRQVLLTLRLLRVPSVERQRPPLMRGRPQTTVVLVLGSVQVRVPLCFLLGSDVESQVALRCLVLADPRAVQLLEKPALSHVQTRLRAVDVHLPSQRRGILDVRHTEANVLAAHTREELHRGRVEEVRGRRGQSVVGGGRCPVALLVGQVVCLQLCARLRHVRRQRVDGVLAAVPEQVLLDPPHVLRLGAAPPVQTQLLERLPLLERLQLPDRQQHQLPVHRHLHVVDVGVRSAQPDPLLHRADVAVGHNRHLLPLLRCLLRRLLGSLRGGGGRGRRRLLLLLPSGAYLSPPAGDEVALCV